MKIILYIAKLILSLRYKVKIKWQENLRHDWPVLLLPNHVALIDPQILIVFLGKYLQLSPVASEKYYNKPLLKQVMDLVGTVPIWEMEAWADWEKIKEVFWKIVEALKWWKNILIYPSWQIYRQGFESIKWKQSVYNICQNMPENTKVIWLNQKWLWWSSWSKSWDNWKTWFFKLFWKGIFIIFINLIFFVPKRKVKIELEDISSQINLYKNMGLWEFNKFLENFYNKNWEEKINYIKHYFFYNNVKNKIKPEIITWSLEELNKTKNHDLSKIDEKTKNKIFKKIAEQKEIPLSPALSPQGRKGVVNEKSNLITDLYFDSLDLAEIKSFVQANFTGASNPPIWDLKSVWDLIIMAVWQSDNVEEMKKCEWWEFGRRGDLVEVLS